MPFALVALVLAPATAGSLRLLELAGGPHLVPANPRINALPALGAGIQVYTQGIGEPIFGTGQLANALLLGAGWAIYLAVAEHVIRLARSRRHCTATAKIGHV